MVSKKQSSIEEILKILDEEDLELRKFINFFNAPNNNINPSVLQDASAFLSRIFLEW